MPKFFSSIDQSNLEILNYRLQNIAAASLTGAAAAGLGGKAVYDSTNNRPNWSDGTNW